MKTLAFLFVLLLLTPGADAAETLRSMEWDKVGAAGRLSGGELVEAKAPSGGMLLRVSVPGRTEILTIDHPGITRPVYALTGELAYENVVGEGYVEMTSYFAGQRSYFSRTLAASGPLSALKGSSGWRPFMLPFSTNAGDPASASQKLHPEKLTLSVVLPQGGTVDLRALRLVQFESDEDPLAFLVNRSGHWWTNRTGALVGSACGAVIGCLGALIGLLAASGKAKTFVLGLMKFLAFLGATGLVLGIVALVRSQPYAVYYPLLLVGGLTMVIFGGLFRSVRKRYETLELRIMQAADLP
jgi:hypothetical protein